MRDFDPKEKALLQVVELWLASLHDTLALIHPGSSPEVSAQTDIPEWLRKCATHLEGTMFAPVSKALPEEIFTPYRAGYAIGLIKWGVGSLQDTRKKLITEGIEGRLSHRGKRMIGKMLEVFYLKEGFITRNEYRRSQFIPHDARRYASQADDLPAKDASEYYRGLSDGLKGIGAGVPGDRSNEATAIHWVLAMWWRLIARFESVTQLHDFLCRLLGPTVIGDKKRVEKICERLELRFRRPGRPPKKSDTAMSG